MLFSGKLEEVRHITLFRRGKNESFKPLAPDAQLRVESLVDDALFDPDGSNRWKAITSLHEEFQGHPSVLQELSSWVDDLNDPISVNYMNWGNDPTVRRNLLEVLQGLVTLGNGQAVQLFRKAQQRQQEHQEGEAAQE